MRTNGSEFWQYRDEHGAHRALAAARALLVSSVVVDSIAHVMADVRAG